jgi:hypothetical protein
MSSAAAVGPQNAMKCDLCGSSRAHELFTSPERRFQRIRNVTTTSAILGTADYLRGGRETLAAKRVASHAVQPLVALLDALRLGDELELIAIVSQASEPTIPAAPRTHA